MKVVKFYKSWGGHIYNWFIKVKNRGLSYLIKRNMVVMDKSIVFLPIGKVPL